MKMLWMRAICSSSARRIASRSRIARTSSERRYRPISDTSAFTAYNTDAFDDNEQIRLAKFIDEINLSGAKIVLSNSDPKNVNKEDNFFDDLYKNYKINRVEASRAINSKGDKRGKISELIICN